MAHRWRHTPRGAAFDARTTVEAAETELLMEDLRDHVKGFDEHARILSVTGWVRELLCPLQLAQLPARTIDLGLLGSDELVLVRQLMFKRSNFFRKPFFLGAHGQFVGLEDLLLLAQLLGKQLLDALLGGFAFAQSTAKSGNLGAHGLQFLLVSL